MLQKQVVELKEEQGLSFAEIGEELDISKSQAYQLYQKANEKKTFINKNTNVQKRSDQTFTNDDVNVQKRSKKPFIHSSDIPQTPNNMDSIIQLRKLEMEHEIALLDKEHEHESEKKELKEELEDLKEELESLTFNYEDMENTKDRFESVIDNLRNENDALKTELSIYKDIVAEAKTDEYEEQENEPIELTEDIKNDIFELFRDVKKYVHNKNNSSIFLDRIENIEIDFEDKYPNIDPSEHFDELNCIVELKKYLEDSKQYHSLLSHYSFETKVPKDLRNKINNYIYNS